MAKLRKCDECAHQGICKIEDDYRMISKNMDQVYNSDVKDSYFGVPDLICYRFIRNHTVSRTNSIENEASNKILNEQIIKNLSSLR